MQEIPIARFTMKVLDPHQLTNGMKKYDALVGDKRLTITIRDDLYKQLKTVAVEKNITAGELIEELIETYL